MLIPANHNGEIRIAAAQIVSNAFELMCVASRMMATIDPELSDKIRDLGDDVEELSCAIDEHVQWVNEQEPTP